MAKRLIGFLILLLMGGCLTEVKKPEFFVSQYKTIGIASSENDQNPSETSKIIQLCTEQFRKKFTDTKITRFNTEFLKSSQVTEMPDLLILIATTVTAPSDKANIVRTQKGSYQTIIRNIEMTAIVQAINPRSGEMLYQTEVKENTYRNNTILYLPDRERDIQDTIKKLSLKITSTFG